MERSGRSSSETVQSSGLGEVWMFSAEGVVMVRSGILRAWRGKAGDRGVKLSAGVTRNKDQICRR